MAVEVVLMSEPESEEVKIEVGCAMCHYGSLMLTLPELETALVSYNFESRLCSACEDSIYLHRHEKGGD